MGRRPFETFIQAKELISKEPKTKGVKPDKMA